MHFFFNNSDVQDVHRTGSRQQVAAGGGFFFQGGPIAQAPLLFGVQQQFAPVPATGQQTGGQAPSVQTAGGTSSAVAFPLPPPIVSTPPPTAQPPADVTGHQSAPQAVGAPGFVPPRTQPGQMLSHSARYSQIVCNICRPINCKEIYLTYQQKRSVKASQALW